MTYIANNTQLDQGKKRKPMPDIETAKGSEPDTSNHYFDDGKSLVGGFVVPIGFYNAVKFEAIAILIYLNAVDEYDAEDLSGSNFWHQLQPYEQRLVDPILKTLIQAGELPLKVAAPYRSFPVSYVLDLRPETRVRTLDN